MSCFPGYAYHDHLWRGISGQRPVDATAQRRVSFSCRLRIYRNEPGRCRLYPSSNGWRTAGSGIEHRDQHRSYSFLWRDRRRGGYSLIDRLS